MPDRVIRKRSCSSPTLAALSGDEERCWWRLLTHADDFGRYEADPRIIKGACFPVNDSVTPKHVTAWLRALEANGLVAHYKSADRVYGVILTMSDHNRVRASSSKFPEPPADICQHVSARDDACCHMFLYSESESESESETRGRAVSAASEAAAQRLKAGIVSVKPDSSLAGKPPPLAWARDIERLHRIDNVPYERILAVIAWLPTDPPGPKWDGWQAVIQSGAKLRSNFDKIELAMRRPQRVAAAPKSAHDIAQKLRNTDF